MAAGRITGRWTADAQMWRRTERPKACRLALRPTLRAIVAAKLETPGNPSAARERPRGILNTRVRTAATSSITRFPCRQSTGRVM